MTGAQIRKIFLDYFKKNGHTVVDSSSLVPSNDPTLMFTTAGMVQFKDVFLGKDPRPYTRASSSQKCVRAGGKHNDLENVGFTARHHTFFEMLGNFSFGDYFKKEAIHFAWELVTKELKLPKDRLYVTVFETDDEAAEIWHKQEGVPLDRIYRFGEKDNFWAMGDTGPCGPCTELFIDRGEKYGCGKPTCKMGCDCDRFMEFWNLVFMQYDRDASGKLNPLPKPSVDTGAGLERLASILQDVDTNYDTDIFVDIIGKISKLAAKPYLPKTKDESVFSFRVIADHARATTFLISDGVMPSNEGRGYVLRRIMRRAIRHGRKLGFSGPFLHQCCGFVIDQMKEAFPDLTDKRAFIERAVMAEEEQFFKTLDRGLGLLDEELKKLGDKKTLSGAVAFTLYDTFGFPLDLTRTICEERGITVDEKAFETHMEKQREESRKHWKGTGDEVLSAEWYQLSDQLKKAGKLPEFVGYEHLEATGETLAVIPSQAADGSLLTLAVFSKTPFYGESGGQTGDRGRVRSEKGDFEAEVLDVQRPVPELIVAYLKPKRGILKVGDRVVQTVESDTRSLTARNHTATHMLQWALRSVLGNHVKQAGSLVTPELLRFDFSHFQALAPEELQKVENLINEKIWRGDAVKKQVMNKDQAIQAGAIAFFGEKYGDAVRVVSVGDYSTELCGGTHVDQSSDIHLFKIASEAGIAAGVRRIIAYTSKGAFQYLRDQDQKLKTLRDQVKASSVDEIGNKIDRMVEEQRELRKQIEKLQASQQGAEIEELLKTAKESSGVKVIAGVVESASDGMKKLREMADRLKQKEPASVSILGIREVNENGEKPYLVVAVGSKVSGVHAGEIIKGSADKFGGKGGGKPDFAQAGGTRVDQLQAAIDAAKGIVLEKLGR
ncbi:MAG: alanine--tRNA ligase [Bdellovibrionales bacterium]|nr:alanine--tRNA ligase [Bdellovibrionales bacterium]